MARISRAMNEGDSVRRTKREDLDEAVDRVLADLRHRERRCKDERHDMRTL